MRIQTNINSKLLGIPIGLVGILTLMMVCCPMIGRANAWSEDASEATAQSDLRTTAQLWAKPTIAVSLAEAVNLEVIPKSTGVFTASSANLTVETNSKNGLKVLINATDGSDLTSDDQNITASIKPVASTVTKDQFAGNTWGYYVGQSAISDTTAYAPVPTTTTEVLSTATSGSTENYHVAFGAKVDTTLPAGMYSNSVLVSVVANPIAVTLSQLTTMQEMTPGICEATTEGSTKQLIDTRDNKSYWVAKLKDGRCWMVQNLALDLTEAGLSAKDTDIASDWDSSSTYPPIKTYTKIERIEGINKLTAYSWDLGKWVIATPLNIPDDSCTASQELADACPAAGLVDVSSSRFQPTLEAKAGIWTYSDGTKSNVTTITIDCSEWNGNTCVAGSYDPHYLIGNKYSYAAATAGSGLDIADVDAEAKSSICPKGWELPGRYTNNNSYWALISSYGFKSGSLTGTLDNRTYHIVERPLYLADFGQIEPAHIKYYMNQGSYWTSVSKQENYSGRMFSITANGTGIDDSHHSYLGMSVRCINKI